MSEDINNYNEVQLKKYLEDNKGIRPSKGSSVWAEVTLFH